MTPAEKQEFEELKRLEALEAKFGQTQPAGPGTSAPQSALEHFGDAATMGYLPQIQAGVEQGVNKLAGVVGVGPNAVDNKLRSQGVNVPSSSYVDSRDQNVARLAQESQENPGSSAAGNLAGAATSLLMPSMAAAKGAGLGTKTLTGAVTNGVQGALSNPGDTQGEINPVQGEDRLARGGLSALFGAAMPAVASGSSKLGDFLMQKAVGIKKYLPGVGKTLADEGLMGTKEQLQNQVLNKSASRNSALENVVTSLPGQIDSGPVADSVASHASDFQTASNAPLLTQPMSNKVTTIAEDIRSRGSVDPMEALRLKRIAGGVGYRGDEPLQKLESQLAQTESHGYGKALEEAYSNANPNQPNEYSNLNKALSALIKAKNGLNAKPALTIESALPTAGLAGVGAYQGYKHGDVGGAIAGGLSGLALKSALAKSVGGQAATKLANALESGIANNVDDAALKLALTSKSNTNK